MAVSVEPGVGSKWQGLALQEQAKQGVHPRVEPDPLLDLAELEVRLRVEADPPAGFGKTFTPASNKLVSKCKR